MACLPIVPVAVTLYCARAETASATVTTMTAKTAKTAPLHLTPPCRVVTEPDVLFYERRLIVSSERMFSPGRKYDSGRKGVVGPGLLCNYPDRAAVWVSSTGDKYHEIRSQDHFDEARRIPDGAPRRPAGSGTTMGLFRASTRRLGSLFAFRVPAPGPNYGGTLMHRGTIELPRLGALEGVRWRWVLAAGAGVGLIPQLLLFPVIFGYVLASALVSALLNDETGLEQSEQFGYLMGAWGLPVVHMMLALVAASWVARRVGTAPVLHGTLIALVSVVVGQIARLVYEPSYSEEVAKYLALAGGLLGGIESRATLYFGPSSGRVLDEVYKAGCFSLGSASCETYQRKVVSRASSTAPQKERLSARTFYERKHTYLDLRRPSGGAGRPERHDQRRAGFQGGRGGR